MHGALHSEPVKRVPSGTDSGQGQAQDGCFHPIGAVPVQSAVLRADHFPSHLSKGDEQHLL